eukprot:395376-Alexandrium_andersonii.AAC.1
MVLSSLDSPLPSTMRGLRTRALQTSSGKQNSELGWRMTGQEMACGCGSCGGPTAPCPQQGPAL